jgi:hypothetical protein
VSPAAFSSRFYNDVLQQDGALACGDAFMKVGQEMATAYPRDPVACGTTVLWGNPDSRLR